MHSPNWAWALLIAILLGGLAAVLASMLFLAWKVWHRRAVWWRWPALVSIALLLLGGGISLGRVVTGLV